jgi:hypothetical protein
MGAAARSLVVVALGIVVLAGAGSAGAVGGTYVFDGGTEAERATVVAALDASAFDWSVVPARVTIRIRRGEDSNAVPGRITLDADLLDAGVFAWGVVQHEYAHQVDFLLLDAPSRKLLLQQLGGVVWCSSTVPLPHAAYGCERFASTLAWAYWPVRANCMRPLELGDESGAMPPAQFRAVVDGILLRRSIVRGL